MTPWGWWRHHAPSRQEERGLTRVPLEISRARAFVRLHPDDQRVVRTEAMRPRQTQVIDLHVGMVADLRRQHLDDVRSGLRRARLWWLRFPVAALALSTQWPWLCFALMAISTLYLPGQRLRALTAIRRRECVTADLHVIDVTDSVSQDVS